MNRSFREPLVTTETGGKRGGGARVTVAGRRILTLYRRMEADASAAVARDMKRFSRLMRR
jgi:molybdate transport system regulatory protein